MQWTSWIGLALGVVMVSAAKLGPPPVMLDLGPVVPTPVPSPESAEKKRLITTITVQNSPEGESMVSFEATDVADQGKGREARIRAACKRRDGRTTDDRQVALVLRMLDDHAAPIVEQRTGHRARLHIPGDLDSPRWLAWVKVDE